MFRMTRTTLQSLGRYPDYHPRTGWHHFVSGLRWAGDDPNWPHIDCRPHSELRPKKAMKNHILAQSKAPSILRFLLKPVIDEVYRSVTPTPNFRKLSYDVRIEWHSCLPHSSRSETRHQGYLWDLYRTSGV